MPALTKILQSVERSLKGELPLWHGTNKSPTNLAEGIGKLYPGFSADKVGSGLGLNEGAGLYASSIPAEGKYFAELAKDRFGGDKYLYRVAFPAPHTKYIDYFHPSDAGEDVITKLIHDKVLRNTLRYSAGEDIIAALQHEHGSSSVLDNYIHGFKSSTYNDKVGGLNFTLLDPSKARILDAFKFGLPLAAGVGQYQTGSSI